MHINTIQKQALQLDKVSLYMCLYIFIELLLCNVANFESIPVFQNTCFKILHKIETWLMEFQTYKSEIIRLYLWIKEKSMIIYI